MTVRQAVRSIWCYRWFVLATTVLTMIIAGIVQSRNALEYASTAEVRVLAQTPSNDGTISTLRLNTGPEVFLAPDLQESAVETLGARVENADKAVTPRYDDASRTMSITVTGPDSQTAQRRANAYTAAYIAYLFNQIKANQATMQKQADSLIAQIQALQPAAGASPNLAASEKVKSLSAAHQRLTELIVGSSVSGAPAMIKKPAPAGTLNGLDPRLGLGLAMLLGLLAGCGVALLRVQFDDRIRDGAQLEDVVTDEIPLLGELPRHSATSARSTRSPIPVVYGEHTAFTEGVRSLRTSLDVALLGVASPVVQVTSAHPGDGKSYVSLNLAAAMAQTGRRVVLVESDLRKGDLSRLPGVRESAGLAELLADAFKSGRPPSAEEVRRALRPTGVAGLDVLVAGRYDGKPEDLLGSHAWRTTLEHLRAVADVVVLDSPPVLALADGLILAGSADGVVLLASRDKTTKSTLRSALQRLERNGAKVLGVVLNRTKPKLPRSYGPYLGWRSQGASTAARRASGSDSQASAAEGAVDRLHHELTVPSESDDTPDVPDVGAARSGGRA